METNPYDPPRELPQAVSASAPDRCTWIRCSWILPLVGTALAFVAGTLFVWFPSLGIMESLAILASWTGILGGFLFSVATGIRFLITRRGGRHALAGFGLVFAIPVLFVGLATAFAQWQIDEQERQRIEYEKSASE